jgi:hypothetical protein
VVGVSWKTKGMSLCEVFCFLKWPTIKCKTNFKWALHFLKCPDLCVCEGQIPLDNVPWGWIHWNNCGGYFYFGRLPFI